MKLNKETLINLYRVMLTIRRFEERVMIDYHQTGAIPGIVHSYIGQEAVAAGVCTNLRWDDRIVSNHRGHGHCIAKGADLNKMMAEIYGKKTGYCKGKGGSMHIADFRIGMLGANGIVAGGLPISAGAALAAKLEGGDKVAVVFFGDGATNEGEFHEVLNLAKIWQLPLIFACENNLYGVNTHVRVATGLEHVSERATGGYGIPSAVIDGNDVVAVYGAAKKAIAGVRAGGGPIFLEFMTYRWRNHYEQPGLPDLRPPEEIEAWKKKCPVANFERKLLENGTLTAQTLEKIKSEVTQKIDASVKFAVESPLPAPEDALEDVFSA
ncbi:MAG: pyruvate dehydrogenase (acetyl-transferring) E1 component subunit alpha [Chloroflexi bacterium RBG_16_50_11]|nr:MAG: pyruvate dehydrogenase (acetyl-transferring) E1 component subunit alpha [Chloroflexi bacterium RBG_16_50_11]